MQGITERHNKNGFCVCQIHYSADPEKATGEWKEKTKRGMPQDSWDQEYEIDFSKYLGRRYYTDFQKAVHVRSLIYNSELTLYRGWDYGYHFPCVVFTQMDLRGRWCILSKLLGKDTTIRKFAPDVIRVTNEWFPLARIKDFGDPAGNHKSDKEEKTTVQILKAEFNIHPTSRPSNSKEANYTARREIIIGKLTKIIDGLPALLINDTKECEDIVDGFNGGYHFPEKLEGRPEKDEPFRDGYYEHVFNALEYIAVNLFKPFEQKDSGKVRRSHPQADYGGWE